MGQLCPACTVPVCRDSIQSSRKRIQMLRHIGCASVFVINFTSLAILSNKSHQSPEITNNEQRLEKLYLLRPLWHIIVTFKSLGNDPAYMSPYPCGISKKTLFSRLNPWIHYFREKRPPLRMMEPISIFYQTTDNIDSIGYQRMFVRFNNVLFLEKLTVFLT